MTTALNKAYSAATIGMPPDDFYAAIAADGAVAGAIGVAGAMTGAEDRRIAAAAVRAAGR